ncbi:hypothetical protein ACFWN2_06670 [Lentzea sp. NPDC058436]|uniref:hypothetical protein n=1 Tax=Lentzea sp. NPDC058436 TaxID=3346499 RepID=UPI0036614611
MLLLALETTAAELTEAAATAKAEAEQARRAYDKLIHRIETAEEELERREKATAAQSDTLTGRLRVAEATFRDLPVGFHRGAELSVAAIKNAVAHVEAQRRELNTLEQRHRDEVEAPRQFLVQQLHVLAERASAAIALVLQGEVPARPRNPALSDDVHWAGDVVSAAQSALRACADQADALDGQIVEAEKGIAAAYIEAAVADGEALPTSIRANDVALALAKRDDRPAERALPRCRELDERLDAARPVVDALRELAAQLSDGKFVNSVVRRRQRRVLLVANTILGRMTDDQFGFAEDFRIIDTSTAQARDVKTLSGGERFLASLALA